MQQKVLHSSPKNQNPFSLQKNSRDSAAYAEKTTLPRVRADVSGSIRVADKTNHPVERLSLKSGAVGEEERVTEVGYRVQIGPGRKS